ncbi:unnamed protein product [Camellia sinensis]
MTATFIVFVCSKLICGRIRGVGSRQMSEIESRIDLEQIEQQQWRIDLSRVSSAVLVSLIMYGKSNWHWMWIVGNSD